MARIVGSIVAGVAGNALFWLVNAQIVHLSGEKQYWAMAGIFAVLFALAYLLLQKPESAPVASPPAPVAVPPAKSLASDLESEASLKIDVSGATGGSGETVIASRNKSVGDMTIVAKDVDLG